MTEREIFDAALAIADPASRTAYLEDACGGDAALRDHIAGLLEAHPRLGSFLELPGPIVCPTIDQPSLEKPGTQIGPYKLLQQIGEGGMGVVYMAEQSEPVQRKVALKVIKPGMDSRQVIARFEAEKQALAMMDHVNIARVLDAGATESGRPYFVMELVHGVPITKYCDDNRLTPRQRLELFVPVCQAIQHAHQKGIIHRDIKPSNVMVTLYDGKPVPKVIDFGVAKAMDQKLTEQTLFTQYGTMVGTLEYMSPEQAEMSALGVDTRSDIYSLGVLLYELLTGSTPLSRQQMKEAAHGEILRLIKDVEPPKPSTRLSESGEALASISALRQTEPAKLSKLMRGELDWIVMKTLEKDRNRRYETASGFAADLQRYLADETVSACPPSALYRLKKFARKNRRLLTTVVALGTLLVVATVGTGIAAVQSRRLADKEQELRTAAEQRADTEAKGRDELSHKLYLNRIALAQQELYAQNIGRAHELLDECPVLLRGWEWRFLKRFRPGNPLALPGNVGCGTFSPDGRYLATRRDDKLVDIVDSKTGEQIRTLQASSTWIDCYALAFCRSDGETLLAVGDAMGKVVKIWNVDTGQELRALEGHAVRLRNVAFSPDGRHLAVGCISGGAKVWDWKSGQIAFEIPNASVSRFAYSPDGRRLAIAVFETDHGVEVHDAATGREIRAFGNHVGGTESVAYHPHAPQLATCGNDGTVKIWDEATGTLLRTLRGHSGPVKDVVFTPDGHRVVSAGWDKTLKVWEVETGQETLTLRGHVDTVMKLEFSRDGERLASVGLGDVMIWDAPPGDEAAPLGVMSVLGHSNLVTSVAFSPNGRLLATGDADRLINVWNISGLAQGRLTLDRTFQRDPDIGVSIAFSPDSRRLASAGWIDARLQVWDTETSRVTILPVHKPLGGRGMAFSPDGRRIASTGPGAIGECDAITGENLWSDKALGNMNGLAYSPDGKYLAVSNYSHLNIRDRDSSKELRTLEHPAIIWGVAFSPDSQRVVTACFDHSLRLWDPTNGRQVREFRGHTARAICVAFSPDGQRLASGSEDSTVKVWDVPSGRELITLRGHRGYVWSVAFSPNGAWLTSAGGHAGKGEVKIWTLAPILNVARQPEQLQRARRHAVEFYRMTAAAQPKVWEHQRNLGQACIQAQHWDEATVAYSTAIDLNPTACPTVMAALLANGQEGERRKVVRGLIAAVERMSTDQPEREDLRRAHEYASKLLNKK